MLVTHFYLVVREFSFFFFSGDVRKREGKVESQWFEALSVQEPRRRLLYL
jgi:hypothetical protein